MRENCVPDCKIHRPSFPFWGLEFVAQGRGSVGFGPESFDIQYLQDHWTELNSLGEIATACHLDPAYLCRLFQRFDLQSPYQFLLRLKINHAAERLRTGEFPVAHIAEELHFADQFHFSRTFKKLMGICPSHFIRLSSR